MTIFFFSRLYVFSNGVSSSTRGGVRLLLVTHSDGVSSGHPLTNWLLPTHTRARVHTHTLVRRCPLYITLARAAYKTPFPRIPLLFVAYCCGEVFIESLPSSGCHRITVCILQMSVRISIGTSTVQTNAYIAPYCAFLHIPPNSLFTLTQLLEAKYFEALTASLNTLQLLLHSLYK
jgi:hypothetical protein